jgi:hypothetical protein
VELLADLDDQTVSLVEPADTARFALRVQVSPADPSASADSDDARARLGRLLETSGAGRLADGGAGDAYIDPAALRSLAAGQVAPGWEEQFGAMVAFASEKGWVDPHDGFVQAHVEWPGTAGGAT